MASGDGCGLIIMAVGCAIGCVSLICMVPISVLACCMLAVVDDSCSQRNVQYAQPGKPMTPRFSGMQASCIVSALCQVCTLCIECCMAKKGACFSCGPPEDISTCSAAVVL